MSKKDHWPQTRLRLKLRPGKPTQTDTDIGSLMTGRLVQPCDVRPFGPDNANIAPMALLGMQPLTEKGYGAPKDASRKRTLVPVCEGQGRRFISPT